MATDDGGGAEGRGAADAFRRKKFADIREKFRQLTERLEPELYGPDIAGALLLSGADTMIKVEGRDRCVKYLRDLADQVERSRT